MAVDIMHMKINVLDELLVSGRICSNKCHVSIFKIKRVMSAWKEVISEKPCGQPLLSGIEVVDETGHDYRGALTECDELTITHE